MGPCVWGSACLIMLLAGAAAALGTSHNWTSYLAPAALGAPLLVRADSRDIQRDDSKEAQRSRLTTGVSTVAAVSSDSGNLPCKRPQVWSQPRTLDDARWTIEKNFTTNAMTLSIQHQPVAGVTGKMMKWMFENLDKVAADYRSGNMYQLYVMMHPLDNNYLLYDPLPLVINATDPSQGSSWNHDHFYTSGCNAVYKRGQPTVICPVRRRGFTCTTPTSIVQNATRFMQASFYAAKLDSSGFTAVLPAGSWNALHLEHRWNVVVKRGRPQLHITHKFVFGIEDEAWADQNLDFFKLITASTNEDMNLLLAKVALHEIEIAGFLSSWLPQVHRAATSGK